MHRAVIDAVTVIATSILPVQCTMLSLMLWLLLPLAFYQCNAPRCHWRCDCYYHQHSTSAMHRAVIDAVTVITTSILPVQCTVQSLTQWLLLPPAFHQCIIVIITTSNIVKWWSLPAEAEQLKSESLSSAAYRCRQVTITSIRPTSRNTSL